MFKVENNSTIGKYLEELIVSKYKSRRKFCEAYLEARGEETSEDNKGRMANRITQITKGNKGIQLSDLPIFTELLGVSCEQLLSAGEYAKPLVNRPTNYSIACSKDPAEWQRYVDREDNLIMNEDEYCKTAIDYALEFRNYEFIKFLMKKKYIWFDSHDQEKYIVTFGAGSSFKRRDVSLIDWGLEGKLKGEDKLRTEVLVLAVDNEDYKMLDELHAREVPQLYWQANYYALQGIDIIGGYNEKLIKHVAASSEKMLDYFTDTFTVPDRSGKRTYTFQYPFISELLDQMEIEHSGFLETALKKCLKYNEKVYSRLKELITSIKNDPYYSKEYMKDMCTMACKQSFAFVEEGNFVLFDARYSDKSYDGLITNIAHIKKIPKTPILKHLAEELNESYEKIITITEHLEEI